MAASFGRLSCRNSADDCVSSKSRVHEEKFSGDVCDHPTDTKRAWPLPFVLRLVFSPPSCAHVLLRFFYLSLSLSVFESCFVCCSWRLSCLCPRNTLNSSFFGPWLCLCVHFHTLVRLFYFLQRSPFLLVSRLWATSRSAENSL